MISRGFIRIEGPAGAGKTTFIERVLAGNRSLLLAAARADEVFGQKPTREIREGDSHINRFLEADACAASAFQFNFNDDAVPEECFWTSRLMEDYFHGLLMENPGPLDLGWDHTVYIMRPLKNGEALFERGTPRLPPRMMQSVMGMLMLGTDYYDEDVIRSLMSTFGKSVNKDFDFADRWRLKNAHAGLAMADTVIVHTSGRERAPRLQWTKEQIRRMTSDPEIKRDVRKLWAGSRRLQVDFGNLQAKKQPEINRALNRIRAVFRRASEYEPE